MNSWLIVNSFLLTEKYTEIYDLLTASAKKHGIDLELKKSSEVCAESEFPDFAVFWDKDFYTARILENKGVRLFNSREACEICDDKGLTSIVLDKAGLPHPRTIISPKAYPATGYSDLSFAENAAAELGFPLVIKEVCGSFGQQVYLADDMESMKVIIGKLSPGSFIMQQFISESAGTDIRVNVVGGKVISAIKRSNKHDFRSNITNGGSAENHEPTETEKELALKAADAAGCDFAGVDILPGKNAMICEINASPHFRSSELCGGPGVADAIMKHIKESIQ